VSSPGPLRQLASRAEEHALMREHLERSRPADGSLRVLEAGCGRSWPFDLPDATITGVDLDEAALRIRREVRRDLDEAIVGDVCALDFDDRQFDAVYSAYVLEHVPRADLALANFARWVRPGGVIVLKVPDRDSVRGFATRSTPHWVHVLYYRRVLRIANAGTPGHPPYPTCFHPVVSRRGIRDFCAGHGLEVVEERGDGGYRSFAGRGLASRITDAVSRAVAGLSRGRLDAGHTNLVYVLRRTA
jgi:SAM-dependent methyltransferase